MATGDEQLWKTWDRAANKTGARHSVFWVKVKPPASSGGPAGTMGASGGAQYETGPRYTGSWVDNKREGFGSQVWPNGDKYEGEWRAGRKHGKGTFWIKRRGKLRKQYTGDWAGDRMHGLGIFYYEDGSKYEGEWYHSRRHGRGKLMFANGDVYEGDWQDDVRSGPGVLSLANGDRYEGHWRADKKEGPGRFFYFTTDKMYEGEWADDVAKCGVFMDTPPELSDSRAEDGSHVPPPDAFDLPQLSLSEPTAVFVDAVSTLRRVRTQGQDSVVPAGDVRELYTAAELEHLQFAFAQADMEGTGAVRGADLGVVLQHLGVVATEDDLVVLLDRMQMSEDSEIDFDTFALHMAKLKEPR